METLFFTFTGLTLTFCILNLILDTVIFISKKSVINGNIKRYADTLMLGICIYLPLVVYLLLYNIGFCTNEQIRLLIIGLSVVEAMYIIDTAFRYYKLRGLRYTIIKIKRADFDAMDEVRYLGRFYRDRYFVVKDIFPIFVEKIGYVEPYRKPLLKKLIIDALFTLLWALFIALWYILPLLEL